jgi:hypothetical protein
MASGAHSQFDPERQQPFPPTGPGVFHPPTPQSSIARGAVTALQATNKPHAFLHMAVRKCRRPQYWAVGQPPRRLISIVTLRCDVVSVCCAVQGRAL